MESAVPPSLRCPRSLPRRIDDDFIPPYPAYTSYGAEGAGVTVMAYLGVQTPLGESAEVAVKALGEIIASLSGVAGPAYYDLARYRDTAGHDNAFATAYWTDQATFDIWRVNTEAWWQSDFRRAGRLGYFREIFFPTRDRFETLYSGEHVDAVGIALGDPAGPIQEHGYWGSMRDRLPLAQTDKLQANGKLEARLIAEGHVQVIGHGNLAMIRSGQDWTATIGEERGLYLEKMEPVFRDGMDFLTASGREIGCYSNRYVTLIKDDGTPLEQSFGLSHWRSLSDMERWSEIHPTHLRIFATFMDIVQELRGSVLLKLYHEVSVFTADQQFYEYINCHDQTGVLGAAMEVADTDARSING